MRNAITAKPTRSVNPVNQPIAPNLAPYSTTSRPVAYPTTISVDWMTIPGSTHLPKAPSKKLRSVATTQRLPSLSLLETTHVVYGYIFSFSYMVLEYLILRHLSILFIV